MKYPKISIVTPSYNHAHFIERTIKSVLSQDYPNLEYIVMDWGSKDGTVDILKKYSKQIKWKSERDSGQSEAINKGLRMATGSIVAFLNSDDTYEPGALFNVAEYFEKHPDIKWAYGKCRIINENDTEIRRPITWYKNFLLRRYSYNKLLTENFISQPATFWKKELHKEIGYINEDEHYTMDYEFWLRIGQKYTAGVINNYLANFRMYNTSKSGSLSNPQFQDELRIAKKFSIGKKLPILIHKANYYKITWIYQIMASTRQGNKHRKHSK
jgi:glycosyltransferase involved in cell wall biosynthesis